MKLIGNLAWYQLTFKTFDDGHIINQLLLQNECFASG